MPLLRPRVCQLSSLASTSASTAASPPASHVHSPAASAQLPLSQGVLEDSDTSAAAALGSPSPPGGPDPAPQPAGHTFTTLGVANFCVREGLSQQCQDRLLGLFHDPRFNLADLSLRSYRDVHRIADQLRFGVGFKAVDLSRPGDHQLVVLHMRDPIQLVQLLLDDAFAQQCDAVILTARPTHSAAGERQYRHPMDSEFAVRMQALLPPGTTPLLLQFYSDKTRVAQSASGASLYPVIITLLNLVSDVRERQYAEGVVGYLPTLKKVAGLPADQHAVRAVQVLHAALELITAPFKQAGRHGGLRLRLPNGDYQRMMPLLANILADYPEQRSLATQFGSAGSTLPCPRCLVARADLADVTSQWPLRTPALMDTWRQLAEAGGQPVARQHAMHPVPCAFHGFFGSNSAPGNVHLAFTPEGLHSDELGLFLYLLDGIRTKVLAQYGVRTGNALLRRVETRLCKVTPSSACRLPRGGAGYLTDRCNVSASEHRCAMQVLPFALMGLFRDLDPPGHRDLMAEGVVLFVDFFMLKTLRNLPQFHTADTLLALDRLLQRLIAFLEEHIPQTSDWRLIKVHMQTHVTPSIRHMGPTRSFNANFGEQSHKFTCKQPYRNTNRQTTKFVRTVAKFVHRQQAFGALCRAAPLSSPAPARCYESSSTRARRDGVHALAAGSTSVAIAALTRDIVSGRRLPPELGALCALWALDMAFFEGHFAAHLAPVRLPRLMLPCRIEVAASATLCARLPWLEDGALELQTVRTNTAFHGRPVFSDVKIQVGRRGESDYGRLLLMFSARVWRDGQRQVEDFAYVRWLERSGAGRQDVLACTRLRWRTTGQGTGRRAVCGVVPLSSIVRTVDLQPAHATIESTATTASTHLDARFYVNRFRWS